DVFYNLTHSYDPEMPNFNHRPFYCVTDRGHIYTRNKDLDNLAQKSEDDDYKISVRSNFQIPEKPSERSNHIIIIGHIDEMLDILREQPASGDNEEEDESNII
ncbi:MAG: hypothetical protein ACKPKO_52595, partial [Candidatus Fonsibacter sp.]